MHIFTVKSAHFSDLYFKKLIMLVPDILNISLPDARSPSTQLLAEFPRLSLC